MFEYECDLSVEIFSFVLSSKLATIQGIWNFREIFSDFLDPCRGVSCPNYGVCIPNTRSLLGYQCECPAQCPADISTVCGSNGKTYNNVCELKRESCQRKITIAISHGGACSKLEIEDFFNIRGAQCYLVHFTFT